MSIGTEITQGELLNSNAHWLAEQLTSLGFEVVEMSTVADDRRRIALALKRFSGDPTVLLCTGGLGPTSDDLTAEAVARALEIDLIRSPEALAQIRKRYEGRQMPRSNLKQADLPQGATPLANRVGTAPGFAVSLGSTQAFFLPGVPAEMKSLFETEVRPRIAALARPDRVKLHLRAYGMAESAMADQLAELERDLGENITLGYRAQFPEIEIKVLARAGARSVAHELASNAAERIRARLGEVVYGRRDDTFSGHVGELLRRSKLTLAVAESCTGGLVGALLTDVPGSSAYFLAGSVCYSNEAKTRLLGVPAQLIARHGAVSAPVVEAMAAGCRDRIGADIGVSITGIAGPGGGDPDKPAGSVWFGLAGPGGFIHSACRKFYGNRGRVRKAAAYHALSLVAKAVRTRGSTDHESGGLDADRSAPNRVRTE